MEGYRAAHCAPLLIDMFRSKKHSQNNDSTQEEGKINELRSALGPLSSRSSKYCTDACLRRYLIARNWNVEKSRKMLEGTLKWRAAYKPEEIRWDEVAFEGETGKVSRASFYDRHGRSVLIMRPGMQNTTPSEASVRHLVYLLENAIMNLGEGQEQMCWLIDFTGFTMKTNVSVKIAADIINVLQNHYPERLAFAFLYNPPKFFQAFWKAIKYFLDPKTFQKVKFVNPKDKGSVELMKSHFDMENLPSVFGGKATLEYDHQQFSQIMCQDELKAAQFWGFDEKAHHSVNGPSSGPEVGPEPVASTN